MTDRKMTTTTDTATDLLRILQGILSSIQGVVGEGAAQALLRYGASEEGKRIAAEDALRDAPGVLGRLTTLVQLEGACEEGAGRGVEVQVARCPVLAEASPVLDTLLLGMMEGMFHGALQVRLKGSIRDRQEGGAARLSFQPDEG